MNWNARAPASCSAAIVDRVERYVLEEVMSGADGGGWVTLGFRSGLEPNDVLHIVASGSRAIYLERFDQAYSLDAAAIAVRAGVSCVEVDLTDAMHNVPWHSPRDRSPLTAPTSFRRTKMHCESSRGWRAPGTRSASSEHADFRPSATSSPA